MVSRRDENICNFLEGSRYVLLCSEGSRYVLLCSDGLVQGVGELLV